MEVPVPVVGAAASCLLAPLAPLLHAYPGVPLGGGLPRCRVQGVVGHLHLHQPPPILLYLVRQVYVGSLQRCSRYLVEVSEELVPLHPELSVWGAALPNPFRFLPPRIPHLKGTVS